MLTNVGRVKCVTMCYKIILLFVVVVTVTATIEKKWPAKYSTEITKISMTDGFTEKLKVWRTKNKSRIDYNDGAVMTYAISDKIRLKPKYGTKYEIHAVTTEDETNEMVCKKMVKQDLKTDLNILPELEDDYEFKGEDTIKGENILKYYYEEENNGIKSCYTLTVGLNENNNNTMVPIRYEKIAYNVWLEGKKSHAVWEYHNFQHDFNEDVFNVSKYNCKEKSESYTPKDKEVTESLLFLDPENNNHLEHAFDAFKKKHGRVYSDYKEQAMRRSIFKQNMRRIAATNRKNLGYKLTINKFSDRTPEELKRYRGLKRRSENEVGTISFPYTETQINQIAQTLPKTFDARMLGLVSPVRDQLNCGSCWTFGTTSAVEGALARVNGGRLLRLSNQALIDCAWGFGAEGCDGGSDTNAYKWITKYGLPTEEEYGTYQDMDGFCRIKNMTEVYKIRGFVDVTPLSVTALKVAVVNHGPLSVSIHGTDLFSSYSGGILYDPTCDATELNHEVTLVGYGEKDGETYWIVKNSWGINWGIDGYFHITTRDNNCGIASEPTYPVF